jgi:hypothetical protein
VDEAQWLTGTQLYPMLRFVKDQASARKFDLFAAACGRHIWHLFAEQEIRAYFEEVERRAEGPATQVPGGHGALNHAWQMSASCRRRSGTPDTEAAWQCRLARCLFGNPFRPVSLEAVWLTPDVQRLASAAYAERLMPSGAMDPHQIAVLADALEDAGAGTDLLAHLREPDPHMRGCWVVDLLAGRS